MLIELVMAGGGVVAGVAWAAWRLKGSATWGRAVAVVMGGPRPTVPK